jgi:hypothetical protein
METRPEIQEFGRVIRDQERLEKPKTATDQELA